MSVTTQERLDIIQAIIESIQDGVFIVDREGNYVNANSAFERITGINREEMVGKHTFYMIQKKWITKAVNLEVIKDLQYRSEMITYPSGKQILVTATPIMIRGGGFVGVVSSLRDVTELGRIQEDLLSSKRIIMDFKKKLETLEGKIAADQDSAVIAQSTEFRRAIFLARRVARSDATVLVTGESGVGKDIIAKYIHEYSARKELGPFVKIDCASLPATLLESELFGYERGAFTNARAEGKKGMFEVASNGTMFLDEIGEIPLEIQSKLLNALQDRQIKRLGGTAAIAVDVRIVSATNVDLAKMVRERKFRQDLYYRLNVVPIHVKPLRERTQDVLPLIKHFLSLYTEQYHQKKHRSGSHELPSELSLARQCAGAEEHDREDRRDEPGQRRVHSGHSGGNPERKIRGNGGSRRRQESCDSTGAAENDHRGLREGRHPNGHGQARQPERCGPPSGHRSFHADEKKQKIFPHRVHEKNRKRLSRPFPGGGRIKKGQERKLLPGNAGMRRSMGAFDVI